MSTSIHLLNIPVQNPYINGPVDRILTVLIYKYFMEMSWPAVGDCWGELDLDQVFVVVDLDSIRLFNMDMGRRDVTTRLYYLLYSHKFYF